MCQTKPEAVPSPRLCHCSPLEVQGEVGAMMAWLSR